MKNQVLTALALAMLTALGLGCARGTDPVGVNGDARLSYREGSSGSGRVLWGLWQCSMAPGSSSMQVVPLRTAEFTANVNKLLEGKPGNLLIQDIDTTDFFAEGRIDCTITLRHPLPGLDMYNGFDVWGVFMHNGSATLEYDNLVYSDGTGPDEGMLLNPDGYTRWFNWVEFDGNGLPLLEYWPGKLSNLPQPTATLNPYRIFADGLDVEDDYYSWITAPGNGENRGMFSAGMANSRRYELKFPFVGGNPKVDFQYAVIATWEPGDPTLTGDPAIYEPGDFPSSANCEEPFFLHVTTAGSDLYNDGSGTAGGSFKADVEVFDWQGGIVAGNGVPNEVNRMIVEGDFVPGGSYEFSQAELGAVAIPATENSSVFQVEIADCQPQASGVADFWVIVEAAGANGETYGQGFPTKYPSGAHRAAFIPGSVSVSGESPVKAVYVDDSNTSGIEDGTQAHPYNTIQEGVDAVISGWEVWVDDSGNPYEEQVNMKSGAIVRSENWDESDGGNRAFIDGPEDAETYSVRFYNVSNAILDGFRIGFAGPWVLEWPYFDCTKMIGIEGGSDITVQDCLFTGQTEMETVYPIVASGAANVTIANCRMASIDRGVNESGCAFFRGVYADTCPDLTVRNCVFTDIRSTEDEASKGIEICYIIGSTNPVVKNNLMHHIIPHAGVGSMGAILMEGFHFGSCPGAEVANNTVDRMDTSDAFSINQCFAYFFDGCSGVEFTNNIATHIYSSGFPPPLARGVCAYNGDTVVCDFTDVWDIGPWGSGANYHGSAVPGTGAISTDPQYIDPDNEDYDILDTSPARWGDPSFVDWDDPGPPSDDPDDYNPDTRSRMGCHGGPDGQYVGLLTPE